MQRRDPRSGPRQEDAVSPLPSRPATSAASLQDAASQDRYCGDESQLGRQIYIPQA